MRRILSLFLMLCLACTYHLAGADAVVTPSEPDPDAQGWIAAQNADGSEGRIYGDLETLIGLRGEGEIFVQAKKAVKISEIDARQLIGVEFAPDPDVFQNGEFRARITTESPDAAEDLSALEDIDLSPYKDMTEPAPVTVYIWVMQIFEETPSPEPTAQPTQTPADMPTAEPTQAPSPEPTAQPTQAPTPEPTQAPIVLSVSAENAVPGVWSGVLPTFELSGIPQGREDLKYAVILYDREITELDGSVYQPASEGVFSVRFVIVDAMGDIVSASDSTTLYLDLSVPEAVLPMPSQQKSYAMVLLAADSLSGVKRVSVDSGETWEPIENEVPYGYVFGQETVLESGMLQIEDHAGNVWKNEEPLVFGAVYKENGGGSGGYYGPHKDHSENTTGDDGTTGYAEAYLSAGEEPVLSLDIAGRVLSLSTEFADGAAQETPFSVQFGKMAALDEHGDRIGGLESLHIGEISDGDDMMLLTAAAPQEIPEGETPAYIWSFDGAALRTLYASGVEHLVLCAGESAAVFPTVGFTAGTKYTELKIGGTGSRYFLYTARMQELSGQTRTADGINRTENTEFSLDADVKGEKFRLVPAADERMYADGVCVIPAEWLDLAQEEYPAIDTEQGGMLK